MEARDGWGLLYIGIEVLRVLIKGVKVMRNLLRDAKQAPFTEPTPNREQGLLADFAEVRRRKTKSKGVWEIGNTPGLICAVK